MAIVVTNLTNAHIIIIVQRVATSLSLIICDIIFTSHKRDCMFTYSWCIQSLYYKMLQSIAFYASVCYYHIITLGDESRIYINIVIYNRIKVGIRGGYRRRVHLPICFRRRIPRSFPTFVFGQLASVYCAVCTVCALSV